MHPSLLIGRGRKFSASTIRYLETLQAPNGEILMAIVGVENFLPG